MEAARRVKWKIDGLEMFMVASKNKWTFSPPCRCGFQPHRIPTSRDQTVER